LFFFLVILASPKLLALGKSQIYLAFLSFIRNFAPKYLRTMIHRISSIIFLLIVLLCQASAQITLSGKVVSDDNGKPIEYASVLVAEGGLWAITDAKGQFAIKGVGKGRLTLTVQCLGYQKRTLSITVNNDVTNLNLKLKEDNLMLNVGFTGNIGGYNSEADPDEELDDYSRQRDNAFRGHAELNWLLNKRWLTNLSLRGALSYSDRKAESQTHNSSASTQPYLHTTEEGYFIAQEYSTLNIPHSRCFPLSRVPVSRRPTISAGRSCEICLPVPWHPSENPRPPRHRLPQGHRELRLHPRQSAHPALAGPRLHVLKQYYQLN
jgi:hypothetical protein